MTKKEPRQIEMNSQEYHDRMRPFLMEALERAYQRRKENALKAAAQDEATKLPTNKMTPLKV